MNPAAEPSDTAAHCQHEFRHSIVLGTLDAGFPSELTQQDIAAAVKNIQSFLAPLTTFDVTLNAIER